MDFEFAPMFYVVRSSNETVDVEHWAFVDMPLKRGNSNKWILRKVISLLHEKRKICENIFYHISIDFDILLRELHAVAGFCRNFMCLNSLVEVR